MRILSTILFYIIFVISLALIITNLPPVVIDAAKNIKIYQWFLYGAGAYFIIRLIPSVRKNETWLQTFSHELSHTIVGMIFFRKIHSFNVEDKGTGVITHSGKRRIGSTFISLAPYCFPIFTYAFMLLRLLGSTESMYIFDLFIGFTAAFHFVCFWKQTRPYQTDLQKVGYFHSYLFIATWRLFNATIILLCIKTGIADAVTYIFPKYWETLVNWWTFIVELTTKIF